MTVPATAPLEAVLPLAGKRIAVPESRLLDVLDGLLTRRGASVLRCPLVSIVDAPDAGPVLDWLYDFIADPPAYFIILTGEGLRRLRGFADSAGIDDLLWRAALQATTIISRGPKPARELRHIDLAPDYFAVQATTPGVIDRLRELGIDRQRVAVQLYGDDPNDTLISYLRDRSCRVECVAPYRYAPALSRDKICELIIKLSDEPLDAIVFTSKAQVARLFEVATQASLLADLHSGLQETTIAAIGPVVAEALLEHGLAPDLMPEERYFMKPLVQLLADRL